MFKNIFHRKWVSPLIIAVSLLPFVTGVLMFFGLKSSLIKGSHEWVGMAMVIIGIAHIFSHWGSFKIYLRKRRLWYMTLVFSVLIPLFLAFVAPLFNDGKEKITPRYFIALVSNSNIESFADFSGMKVEKIEQKLSNADIKIKNSSEKLGVIAKNNGQSIFDLIQIIRE